MAQATVSWQEPDVVLVAGEVDFESVVEVRKAGEALIDRASGALVVDLGGLTSAHSITLSLLMRWISHARRQQKSIHIRRMPSKLFDVARVSGLETVLPLTAD